MNCENHLAIEAILIGLRRSGAIDKRTVQNIVEALKEASAQAQPNCQSTATSLTRLAESLDRGPARSCHIRIAG